MFYLFTDIYDFGETSTTSFYDDEIQELDPRQYTMNPTVGDTTFFPTMTSVSTPRLDH